MLSSMSPLLLEDPPPSGGFYNQLILRGHSWRIAPHAAVVAKVMFTTDSLETDGIPLKSIITSAVSFDRDSISGMPSQFPKWSWVNPWHEMSYPLGSLPPFGDEVDWELASLKTHLYTSSIRGKLFSVASLVLRGVNTDFPKGTSLAVRDEWVRTVASVMQSSSTPSGPLSDFLLSVITSLAGAEIATTISNSLWERPLHVPNLVSKLGFEAFARVNSWVDVPAWKTPYLVGSKRLGTTTILVAAPYPLLSKHSYRTDGSHISIALLVPLLATRTRVFPFSKQHKYTVDEHLMQLVNMLNGMYVEHFSPYFVI